MNFLQTIMGFLKSEVLSVWSRVSGSLITIINELPDDEIDIFHRAQTTFTDALHAGKSWGDAAADTWTYVKNAEEAELGKVGTKLLDAFMTHFEPVGYGSK